nr:MAG TPA: endonuclease-like protein [Caudoviricetes sp.]
MYWYRKRYILNEDDILDQIIRVRVNNFNKEHFDALGYKTSLNEYIYVPAKHLPSGSGLKIKVSCNYCHRVFEKSYRRYLETKDDLCCENCKAQKMEQISLKKYGNKCSLRNPVIQEKSKKKNLEKLGVQYPFQNVEILEKCRNTCIEKYGDDYRSCIISKQQRHLHKLYGGILNYNEFPYQLDIFFEDKKIYLEYDGGGHKISVKTGRCSEDEFLQKELKRELFLKNKGYKEFRICSNTDKLPPDQELLNIKERAYYILLQEGYNKYIYNIDTNTEFFEV